MPNAQEYLDYLQAKSEVDYSNDPELLLRSRLRDALVKREFSTQDAEEIATTLKVELSAGMFNGNDLKKGADLFAKRLHAVRATFLEQNYRDPNGALKNYVKHLHFSW